MNDPDPDREKTSVLLRGIPRELKNEYKAYCARRESNMTADVIQHMKDAVRRDRIALGAKECR